MSRAGLRNLTVLVALFAAGSLNAGDSQGPQGPKPLQAVKGALTFEGGQQLVFSIPEGGGVRLTDEVDGTAYRLIPQKASNGKVAFSILDADSAEVLEVLRLGLDGATKTGNITPFSLSLTGIAPKATQCASSPSAGGLTKMMASCCISCGSWEICCEPASGSCCELQCYNPGESCSACSG